MCFAKMSLQILAKLSNNTKSILLEYILPINVTRFHSNWKHGYARKHGFFINGARCNTYFSLRKKFGWKCAKIGQNCKCFSEFQVKIMISRTQLLSLWINSSCRFATPYSDMLSLNVSVSTVNTKLTIKLKHWSPYT